MCGNSLGLYPISTQPSNFCAPSWLYSCPYTWLQLLKQDPNDLFSFSVYIKSFSQPQLTERGFKKMKKKKEIRQKTNYREGASCWNFYPPSFKRPVHSFHFQNSLNPIFFFTLVLQLLLQSLVSLTRCYKNDFFLFCFLFNLVKFFRRDFSFFFFIWASSFWKRRD